MGRVSVWSSAEATWQLEVNESALWTGRTVVYSVLLTLFTHSGVTQRDLLVLKSTHLQSFQSGKPSAEEKRSRFIISASWQSRRWKVVRSVCKAQRFYAESSVNAALRASLPGVLALWSAAGCQRVAGTPRRGCCLPVGALPRLREFSQALASPSGASPGNTPLPIGWRSLTLDPIDAKQVNHGCLLTK